MYKFRQIESSRNSLIKKVSVLRKKSRERNKTGLFVVEGWRELQLALKGNYILDTVLFQEDFVSRDELFELLDANGPEIISVTKDVYQKLAYRGTTEGVIAVGRNKTHTLDALVIDREDPLILIAEAPEKPGNIGALLRTADAAGLDAIIIANPKTDLYNPNIIRSSVGCVFTTPIAVGSTSEVLSYLRKSEISCYCASLSASMKYTEIDYQKASAIVVGTEATGLSSEWLEHSDQNVIIPMAGEIDSMNVSVSAAILIFEAIRQRSIR